MSKKEKRYVLKKDIVIKAGTIFHCIDRNKKEFIEGNFSTLIGLTNDSCGEFIYRIDEDDYKLGDWFEEVCK